MGRKRTLLAIIFLAVVGLIVIGSLASQRSGERLLEEALKEEIGFRTYSSNGFSVSYPDWPDAEGAGVELSVSRGYCSVSVNSEKIPSLQWYGMFIDSIEKQNGTIILTDEEELHIRFSQRINDLTMISDARVYDCNGDSLAVTVSCIEQAEPIMQGLEDEISGSASCEEQETVYSDFRDDDFSISYPDWDELADEPEQRVLGITRGVCSVIVDKHNALPGDIFGWMENAISESTDNDILNSSKDGNTYRITYEMPYENKTITATTKIFYCNYNSYITQTLCVNEFVTGEYEEIMDNVMESSECLGSYEVPTPEVIAEEKEAVKEEEPEVIEEIEDEIVRTDVGEEFGIDEEMVVYFINGNAFISRVIRDFPRANLVIEDKDNDRELKLRATISDEGKITLLEDGEFSDADVTLFIPLRDALNVFSNAGNINPLTLIGFAVNTRTEPVEIKDQVIQKVLRGEYN